MSLTARLLGRLVLRLVLARRARLALPLVRVVVAVSVAVPGVLVAAGRLLFRRPAATTMSHQVNREPGAPDFSRHKIPKRGKIYPITTTLHIHIFIIKTCK
jgi:hypothetical protein